ncbi:2-oxo acid dehydrogenase subunit E2 [Halalkalirubrum salinum]|uniref:2-oxo acid dehydrogenase subunit E2 n=1 Tax=Halalkalirubrum salinum TaxID=2563889 RepID=UPI0010FBBAA9|nr:2-oxo acid dehydrogenase subunit E2 [Halalkalirubrum salinum]
MAYIVKIPKLGLEMDSGTVVEWYVDEDEAVSEGEPIAEIESEKTSASVDAREDGVLREVFLDVGEDAPPGDPMGIVADPEADITELLASIDTDGSSGDQVEDEPAGQTGDVSQNDPESQADASTTDSATVRASPRAKRRADELGVSLESVEGTGPGGAITEADVEAATETTASQEPVRISPRAKKRADELGVDPAGISGSGPDGAITEADIEAYAAADSQTGGDEASELDDTDRRDILAERPLDGMRRTISSRLGESYRNAVHVTEHMTAIADPLVDAAAASSAVTGEDISVVDVLLTTISAALGEHPEFNGTFENDVHRIYGERNIAIAIDVDDGLVAPVIRGVDSMSIAELAAKRQRVTEKTLSGEYTMDDLTGGTFTVSNLGLLGVESFDPIINPPQIAILGVNAMTERPVAVDGDVVVKRVLPLDLSFDHRIVDGADAARFLGSLVDNIQNPWPLLAGVTPRDIPNKTGDSAAQPLPNRHVTAQLSRDLSGTITAGGYEWPYDVSPSFGGGADPTPVDYFTGALAACLSASIGIQADMRDITFESIDVSVTSAPEEGSVESIEIEVELGGIDAVETSVLERIVEAGERTCHVAELLAEEVEVSLSWKTT